MTLKNKLRALLPTTLITNVQQVPVLWNFFKTQRLKGFAIPDRPHFDTESAPYFEDQLLQAQCYLEYGAGGSTVLAAALQKSFISVDSDPYFLKAVAKKLGGLTQTQQLLYVNIGLTGPWGVPLFTRPTPGRLAHWAQYAQQPWALLRAQNQQPDLILVDGRFRVACALTCIQHLEGQNWRILVDDYVDRPEYHMIESFAKLSKTVGRMAVFEYQPHDEQQLKTTLAKYYSIIA